MTWRRAELAFAVRFGLLSLGPRLEAWEAKARERPELPPPLDCLAHLPTIARLLRALERIDRYGVLEVRSAGAGAGLACLEAMMDAHLEDLAGGRVGCPQHLGYFLPLLEQEGRRAKHHHAPRRKDQRIAEGRRLPRRGQGKPGRGPAIGANPKVLPSREELRRRRRRRRRRGGGGQEARGQ